MNELDCERKFGFAEALRKMGVAKAQNKGKIASTFTEFSGFGYSDIFSVHRRK